MMALLLVLQFPQSSDGRLQSAYRRGAAGPGTSSYCFHAGTTAPNAHTSSLHLRFATEEARGLHLILFFFFCNLFIYLAVLGLTCSMWDLVPWPGIKPGSPASGAPSLSHWTTKEILPLLLYST